MAVNLMYLSVPLQTGIIIHTQPPPLLEDHNKWYKQGLDYWVLVPVSSGWTAFSINYILHRPGNCGWHRANAQTWIVYLGRPSSFRRRPSGVALPDFWSKRCQVSLAKDTKVPYMSSEASSLWVIVVSVLCIYGISGRLLSKV